ncbi:ABC transporter ATP-binding protein [Dactylosporangium siamense]|uniref:Nitrate ABC transporter ATP-binding protein n=1 Tax=Dactylosporangium siamense TaxID=685454 RepID=A0A919UEZ3_9ACTN|nr:ATP-binding cassette domain-containing protein [Dactylosporangium siamense]GIG49135.1 nitrate ABC transporter ATP-binding protein [Dactylosporangium siamense]
MERGATVFVGTHLSRTFGQVAAVRDVSCRITATDRIAVTGASGSGKSTLLQLIAGIDDPSGGRAAWPALDGHPRRRPGRIGIVFQSPALLPTLDVHENVALSVLLAGQSAGQARRAASEALRLLHLDDLADRLPHELSGGQAQRVAVARAVATNPDLVVADEPTAALDSATAAHLLDVLLSTVDRLGAALVLATHDSTVAGRMDIRWPMADGTIPTAKASS